MRPLWPGQSHRTLRPLNALNPLRPLRTHRPLRSDRTLHDRQKHIKRKLRPRGRLKLNRSRRRYLKGNAIAIDYNQVYASAHRVTSGET